MSRRDVLGGIAAVAGRTALPRGNSHEGQETFYDSESLTQFDRFGDPPFLVELVKTWRELPPLDPPEWKTVRGEWEYAKGDKREGLQAVAAQMPVQRSTIQLAHRVLEADTPLWYRAMLELGSPCVIRVNADDGAHLFLNGERIRAADGVFHVPALATGAVDVVVRVLNKAVYGGLEELQWCRAAEFASYQSEVELRDRLTRAITKLRRLRRPSKKMISAAKTAVHRLNIGSISALEQTMAFTPMVTIGPVVHQYEPDAATIAWETDVEADAGLTYRPFGGATKHAAITSDGRFHQAKLSGLTPETVISYRLEHKGSAEVPQKFRTLPARSQFSFTVWGDSHIGYSRFRQNVGALLLEDAAFTVGVGDLVVDAYFKRPWEEFFDLGAPLFASTPVFFMGGNHDYDDCFEDLTSVYFNRYARLDQRPFYSWTVANCRFIALDPNIQFPTGIDEGSEQHRWLIDELNSEEWRAAEWRIVFIHQPPFGRGWTDYAGDRPIRELLEPLIAKHKIDFVVSGHIHDYERLTKTYDGHSCTYLVVGGAGGALEDGVPNPEPVMDKVVARHHYGKFTVEKHRMLFEAFHTDTTILDRYEIRK